MNEKIQVPKKCTKCGLTKPESSFGKNKLGKSGLRSHCKVCCSEKRRYYYEKSRETGTYQENTKKWKEKNRDNEIYVIKDRLRSRTRSAFRIKNYSKSKKTIETLGVDDWNKLKLHIESKFTEGMTWENIGEWEIDHIIPLSIAKSEEELMQLCHYTNIQPLWRTDNRKKSNKYGTI
jgi:hypothetical protein